MTTQRTGASRMFESQRPLVLPWWAWVVIGLLWFEAENEHKFRMIGHRIRAFLD